MTYNPYQSGNNNNVFMTVVLPIVGGVAVVGVATYLTLRYLKKRKACVTEVVAEEIPAQESSEDAREDEEAETQTDTEET